MEDRTADWPLCAWPWSWSPCCWKASRPLIRRDRIGPPNAGDVYLSWGRETVHEPPWGQQHFRQGAWNTVKIQIQGEPARIRFRFNGVAITDFQHTAETTRGVPKEGRFGLQIHAGKYWSTGSRVRFRNIRVTEL